MAAPPKDSSRPRPLSSRKTDIAYIVLLAASIFFAFALDFVQYYPKGLPAWSHYVHDYYVKTYNDPLYAKNPPFFKLYVLIEFIYMMPTTFWIIKGLIEDDRTAALHFLALATHTVSSTLVCFVELISMDDWPQEDIRKNAPAYVIYAVIWTVVWLDTFARSKSYLKGKAKIN